MAARARALIVASSGELEAHVVVVRESEAQFGLKGLINTEADDFSTWIAANTVRISDLYGLLQARGITAVHLWLSGEKRWLSYAVVEDAAVPGSVDYLDYVWRHAVVEWVEGFSPRFTRGLAASAAGAGAGSRAEAGTGNVCGSPREAGTERDHCG